MKTGSVLNARLPLKQVGPGLRKESLGGTPVGSSRPLISTLGANRVEVERLCARRDAVLLYGSFARGDAGPYSDIDLLVLDDSQQRLTKLPNRLSVTVYTPDHLRNMARRGSLFALHLREEAKILVDRGTIVPSLLDEWTEPDYSRLREGMKAGVSVLEAIRNPVPAPVLRRVSLFVLRSVLYAECAKRGKPSFAMSSVANVLKDPRISKLFGGSNMAFDTCRLEQLKRIARDYLGKSIKNPFDGLEALAVGWQRKYPMASYLAVQLLTGGREMGYTAAPVDWMPT